MKINKIAVVSVCVVFFILSLGSVSHGFLSVFGGQHKSVKATNNEVLIPLKDVNDGKAHYFSYEDQGKEVHFFVVKSPDGVVRAAFDACDVCFPAKKGYSQSEDFMVCNNCGRKFHSTRINVVEGGCNPAPLKREVRGDMLVLKVDNIIPGGRFF